ncbi:hypothetical protein GCM10011396_37980 [Undibacterium terreum]|uniref:Uncharacterized protein n=1 Tax=Undibacterium terreum TaxID=1224302 RepID=A0A916UT48_9BURK|nr:hypothetical protein GCM10011396_37980 [Undibacterium terreum]
MVQVPAATGVKVEPDTVQTEVVLEVKLTAKAELADALSPKGAAPTVVVPGLVKLMLCEAVATEIVCCAVAA